MSTILFTHNYLLKKNITKINLFEFLNNQEIQKKVTNRYKNKKIFITINPQNQKIKKTNYNSKNVQEYLSNIENKYNKTFITKNPKKIIPLNLFNKKITPFQFLFIFTIVISIKTTLITQQTNYKKNFHEIEQNQKYALKNLQKQTNTLKVSVLAILKKWPLKITHSFYKKKVLTIKSIATNNKDIQALSEYLFTIRNNTQLIHLKKINKNQKIIIDSKFAL